MKIDIHAMLAKAILTLLPIGLLAGGFVFVRYARGYAVPPEANIFAWVEGKWAWTTADDPCGSDWHQISFSANRDSMYIANSETYEGVDGITDSIASYVIHEYDRHRIRASIPGETRLTASGEPAVWDLALQTPDRYAWHRVDWFPGVLTPRIARCDDTGIKVTIPKGG